MLETKVKTIKSMPASMVPGDVAEINLLDYAAVLVTKRRILIRNCILGMIIGIIVSFILPKKYTAITTFLPPENSGIAPMQTALADLPLTSLGLPGAQSTADLMVEILQSRTVREGVIHKIHPTRTDSLDLFQVFKTGSVEKCLRALLQATTITASEQGIVNIKVTLGDPILAAAVANSFATELDQVNKAKNNSRAKSSRLYIESQLAETSIKLAMAAAALAEFQKSYKAVDLEEQTRIAIEKAGELKGNILAHEIDLGVLLQTLKPENPAIIKKQRQLEEMKKRYAELQYGANSTGNSNTEFYIPFSDVPGVGLKLAELLREVKVQETVWELLNQQYYQAKIQEARDTPTIQVLDEAQPPERRSSPKRKVLVLVFMLLAFVGSAFWAFGQQYFSQVRSHNGNDMRLNTMAQELKSDWSQLKGYFRKNGQSRN